MKAVGFDGRKRNWDLCNYIPKKDSTRPRSNLHGASRLVLRELFPRSIILEEVTLPGSQTLTRKSTLYADFFLPSHDLIVEAHGMQHYEFNPFYHKTKAGFFKSKARDRDKIRWCELNSLSIVIFKYSDDEDEWKRAILER